MVTLSSPHDYVILFAFAAVFGAIGGVAYELAQNRAGRTGSLSLPSLIRWSTLNLGFISSMLLGAVAAVAVSYFFTPEVQVTKVVGKTNTVVTEWQIVKVVPLSLIVGSSGGAFLASLRSKVLSELNAQKVVATRAAGHAAVAQVANAAKAAAAKQAAEATGRIVSDGLGEITGAAHEVPEHLRVNLLQLSPEEQSRVTNIIGAPTDTESIAARANRLTAHVQGALDDATQNATDLIDTSVESAYATIDAAAISTTQNPSEAI